MKGSAPVAGAATAAILMAIPEDERFHEVVGGEVVRKADPSGEHGGVQADLVIVLGPRSCRRGPEGGGWWFATEVEVELGPHEVYRPDVLGWRRERVPERPRGPLIRVRPDWVCEALSPSTSWRDRGPKLHGYHRAGVPHYWLVDPQEEQLTVHRWSPEGCIVLLTAGRADRVRAEPFEALELRDGVLFGDDPDPL